MDSGFRILLAGCAVLALSCSDAPLITRQGNRVALAELFTQTGWAYCGLAERALDSLELKYGDSLVVIEYFQTRGLEMPAGAGRGRWYYGYQQWPWAVFGGKSGEQVTNPDSFYSSYDAQVVRSRADSTPIEIRLDSAGTVVAPPVVRMRVVVNPTDSVVNDMGNLVLVAVVYEDSVPFEQFPGDTIHARLVARAIVGDTWGIPLSLRFGQEFDTTLEVTLGQWRTDYLGVAAFVQDTASKEILQAVVRRRIGYGHE